MTKKKSKSKTWPEQMANDPARAREPWVISIAKNRPEETRPQILLQNEFNK